MLQRNLDPTPEPRSYIPQEITRVLLNVISNGFMLRPNARSMDDENFEATLQCHDQEI